MENVRGPQESICFNLSRGFQLHINKESEACRFIGIPHALYSPWLGSYQKRYIPKRIHHVIYSQSK